MIIVAALVNSALLVAIFISAVKPVQSSQVKEKSARAPLVSAALSEKKIDIEKKSESLPSQTVEKIVDKPIVKADQEVEKKPLSLPVLTKELEEIEPKSASKPPLKQRVEEQRTVKVEKGDVLERIARHHGVSVDEIMRLNHLKSFRLQVGQVLKLPPVGFKPSKKGGGNSKYYTVKGGDNPWTIAHKNGMQVEELLELNNMDEEKAKRLKPGDKLKIR